MARRRKHLSENDRHLWKKVTDTVEPMLPLTGPLKTPLNPIKMKSATGQGSKKKSAKTDNPPTSNHSPILVPALPVLPAQHPFDHKTVKKISKGKMAIDARIDLHGMTQEQANTALYRFIHMARASDYRLVLVITGKGVAGQGILRQRVPDWLSTGELGSIIGGIREAQARHGGSGALYVRLKRAGK